MVATFPSLKKSTLRFLDNGAFGGCSLRFIRMQNNNTEDTDTFSCLGTNPSTIQTQDQARQTTTQISYPNPRKFLTCHVILFIMPTKILPNIDLNLAFALFWKYGPTFVILVTYGTPTSYIDDLKLFKINFATRFIHADWHNEKWKLSMLSLTSAHHIDLPVFGSTTIPGLEHVWYTANKNMNQRYIKSRGNGWTKHFSGRNLPQDIGCGNYADVTKPWNFQRWNQCTLAELQIRLNASVSTPTAEREEEAYGEFDSDFLGIGNLDLFEWPAYAILFNSYNYFIVEELDALLIFSKPLDGITWTIILACIPLLAGILTGVLKLLAKSGKGALNSPIAADIFKTWVFHLFGTLFEQGMTFSKVLGTGKKTFPVGKSASAIMSISWILMLTIVINGYKGVLITNLTSKPVPALFSDLASLAISPLEVFSMSYMARGNKSVSVLILQLEKLAQGNNQYQHLVERMHLIRHDQNQNPIKFVLDGSPIATNEGKLSIPRSFILIGATWQLDVVYGGLLFRGFSDRIIQKSPPFDEFKSRNCLRIRKQFSQQMISPIVAALYESGIFEWWHVNYDKHYFHYDLKNGIGLFKEDLSKDIPLASVDYILHGQDPRRRKNGIERFSLTDLISVFALFGIWIILSLISFFGEVVFKTKVIGNKK
ncbi:hypothetical protein Fcan01_11103 [Folsomia candida]|uniref:Uncharacterized protein n=1 Tax=Folsomia candida TaxID=158441 RepID=A0A226E788_FOLCA|nr:hypothetical protein Fcan01_11103 [Folsomia candida]